MVPTIKKKKKEGKDVLETPWGCATSECWSLCEGFMQDFFVFVFLNDEKNDENEKETEAAKGKK